MPLILALVIILALVVALTAATSQLLSFNENGHSQNDATRVTNGSDSGSPAAQQSEFSSMADNPDGRYSGPLSNGYGGTLLRRSVRRSTDNTSAAGSSPTVLPPVSVSFPVIALLLALASQIVIGLAFILLGMRSRTSRIIR